MKIIKNIIQATGKRKTSVARVTIKKGNGEIKINSRPIEEYITNHDLRSKAKEALIISNLIDKYDIFVNVQGGGQNSQVDAIRQAIAKSLIKITKSDDLKKTFVEYDRTLLIADTRFKEMKKPNNSHARAKRQKSYR